MHGLLFGDVFVIHCSFLCALSMENENWKIEVVVDHITISDCTNAEACDKPYEVTKHAVVERF